MGRQGRSSGGRGGKRREQRRGVGGSREGARAGRTETRSNGAEEERPKRRKGSITKGEAVEKKREADAEQGSGCRSLPREGIPGQEQQKKERGQKRGEQGQRTPRSASEEGSE